MDDFQHVVNMLDINLSDQYAPLLAGSLEFS
jgi:hypothetical protein